MASISASIITLSYTKLLRDDRDTITQLIRACQNEGFFYLKPDSPQCRLFTLWSRLQSFSKALFDLPVEIKESYDFNTTGRPCTSGFKLEGKETGAFEGTRDGFQIYLIPYNELLVPDYPRHLQCPTIVEEHRSLISEYMKLCHDIGFDVLQRLTLQSTHTKLIKDGHCPYQPSLSSLSLLKYSKPAPHDRNIGHVPHTDVGTLTLLHSTSPGLQIWERNAKCWLSVPPQPDSILFNVGDALHLLTEGFLRSSLHRVIPENVDEHRYSTIYFMRPNEGVFLPMPSGDRCSSAEWHERKMKVFAASQDEQNRDNDRRVLLGNLFV